MAQNISQIEISAGAREHPYWVIVERVAASQCFHSSLRLREFLFYVCDCALRNAPEEATEQHIGIHVFQRSAGYNSSEDSIVRTHARLLRQKLTEYFATDGANEETLISIPKGHYLPVFESRTATAFAVSDPSHNPQPVPAVVVPPPQSPHRFRQRWLLWFLPVALLVAVIAAAPRFRTTHDPIERFWSPFMAGNSSLVIYSNAVFVGDSKNGMRYASPMTELSQPLPPNYVDDYTGIGELQSVYDLTHLFDLHHSTFILKRSLLVTWDQAASATLIFLGSVAENPSLRVITTTPDFTITAGGGSSGIINHHPRPGEQALYERPDYPLTVDYAILAFLPGLQPGKKMLVFSGLTTLGTEAAVEFACHEDTLRILLGRVAGKDGNVRPFEALLETTIVGGVPLKTRLIAVHVH